MQIFLSKYLMQCRIYAKSRFMGGKSSFPRNAQKTPTFSVFILHKSKAKLSLHCMVPEWIWSIVLWASICDLTHMLYCSSDSSRSCNRSSMCLFFLMMARSKVSWRTPTSWINSFDFASLRMPLHLTNKWSFTLHKYMMNVSPIYCEVYMSTSKGILRGPMGSKSSKKLSGVRIRTCQ